MSHMLRVQHLARQRAHRRRNEPTSAELRAAIARSKEEASASERPTPKPPPVAELGDEKTPPTDPSPPVDDGEHKSAEDASGDS